MFLNAFEVIHNHFRMVMKFQLNFSSQSISADKKVFRLQQLENNLSDEKRIIKKNYELFNNLENGNKISLNGSNQNFENTAHEVGPKSNKKKKKPKKDRVRFQQ